METITIYVDGGAHNNGSSEAKCYGSMAVEYKGEIKKRLTEDFPQSNTNNQAEYKALGMALDYIYELKGRYDKPLGEIVIKSDSALIVNQVNGKWKIKDEVLRALCIAMQDAITTDMKDLTINIIQAHREEIVKVLGH